MPSRWATQNWRTIMPTIIQHNTHCCEGPEPHVMLFSLGTQYRQRNPQEIWPWGPVGLGFDYRNRDPTLGGQNQNLPCMRTQRSRTSDPTGDWNQTYLLVLEGLMWGQGLALMCHRGTEREQSWEVPLAWALLEVIITPTIRSTTPELACLRSDK